MSMPCYKPARTKIGGFKRTVLYPSTSMTPTVSISTPNTHTIKTKNVTKPVKRKLETKIEKASHNKKKVRFEKDTNVDNNKKKKKKVIKKKRKEEEEEEEEEEGGGW